MRPGTRSPQVDGGTPITLQRSLDGLPTVAGTSMRHAPSQSRPTVHHALLTIERSLRCRTGARRSREGCSRFDCDTPKHELKRIAYFDLVFLFAFPFGTRGGRGHAVSMAVGGRLRHEHDLPTPIRRRCPPFLLWVDAHANTGQSIVLTGRERVPMSQTTSSSPSSAFPPPIMVT